MIAKAETRKPVIEVEDYYDKVHQSAWARRTAGLIGGAMVGMALGAITGVVAACIPFVFGAIGVAGAAAVAAPTMAAIASTAAVFAGVIGLMGAAAMGTVGSDAAAVSGAMNERERREQMAKHAGADVVVKDPKPEKIPSLFNWKVAAVTVPMMAAFGALLALSPMTAAPLAMAGFQGATAAALPTTAAIGASSVVFGTFGTFFGVKMSYLTNKASNFTFKTITGKIFEKNEAPEHAQSPAPRTPEHALGLAEKPAPELEEAPALPVAEGRTAKHFASDTTRFSLQGVIERTEDRASDKEVLVTR